MEIGADDTLSFTYNGLKQLTEKNSSNLDMTYIYQERTDSGDSYTTNRVGEIQYTPKGTNADSLPTLYYTYDAGGNITQVKADSATLATYAYDAQNQLTTERTTERESDYVYDSYGNIRSKTNRYPDANQQEVYIFSYENDSWKDQLSKVTYRSINGTEVSQELEYDAVGNPTEYFNGRESWNFTWQNGRQLATAVSGDTSIINTYDVDGIRDSKTVNGVRHDYATLDGKVVRESYGKNIIDYFYDNEGNPYKIVVNEDGTIYTGYYVLNLQGDVIAIIDSEGALAVEYEYDAWGKEVGYTTSGNDGSKLYGYNALKYRGYYYDAETGFYYVSSRYYDPGVGRFLNADGEISGVGGDIRGYNMYSYCFNNPVNMSDPTGDWPKWVETAAKVLSVVAVVAAVAVTVTAVTAFTAGTGSAAAVYGASILLGATLSGINGAVANSKKGNSYANGYVGGFTGGSIQAACSKSPGGVILGGGAGVTIGTAVTDTLNNIDPDSKNSSRKQMIKNATTSGLKALVTSSVTAYAGYAADLAKVDGAGGLMPSFTYGFAEGFKAFFGWADDAVIYVWE